MNNVCVFNSFGIGELSAVLVPQFSQVYTFRYQTEYLLLVITDVFQAVPVTCSRSERFAKYISIK